MAQQANMREESGNLSPLESLFFHITKVLIYKTVSSPFRVTHLLLQSKNIIIEQHELHKYEARQSTMDTVKSWLFWIQSDNQQKSNTPQIINYLKDANASMFPSESIYASTNTLNLISNIVNNPNYGISYLFVGNLYNIIRGALFHRSCQICYDQNLMQQQKDRHLGNDYNQGWFGWTALCSSLWFGSSIFIYPLHTIYINYLFNFDAKYEIPPFKLSGIAKLYSGYSSTVWQSITHCLLYYRITDIVDKLFKVKRNRSDLLGKILSKYVAMSCVNIICYPLSTIKKRQMITNESIFKAFYNIINTENGGYSSLYDGLYMYLFKGVVAQICIDGCDAFINWYKNEYKMKKLKQMQKVLLADIQDTDIICNICLENKKEYVFNCGHCVCESCKETMIQTRRQCHICRANISSVQRMFL